ncbi:MAG: hypothetical protein ACI8UO_001561 [Verrucomicrobiales bacterium]|jgi:hypothetical protein
MSRKIFLSYARKNRDWVERSLLPILRGAAASDVKGEAPKVGILIDVERFQFGEGVVGQMNEMQDEADLTMMILTPDYLASDYCMHELRRAKKKPRNAHGLLPIKRIECEIPTELKGKDPILWCDQTEEEADKSWEQLLGQFGIAGADGLGTEASKWLNAARDVETIFGRQCLSVNLVSDLPGEKLTRFYEFAVKPLLDFKLPVVDLNHTGCFHLSGLYRNILKAVVGSEPGRLPIDELSYIFGEQLERLQAQPLLIRNFENVKKRDAVYGDDLWDALRWATENRKVILLAESNRPAPILLPGRSVSMIEFKEVRL